MKIGDAVEVAIPEKGSRTGGQAKYPFDRLGVDGMAIPLYLEPTDIADGVELKDLKKKAKTAANQYERKVGRTAKGEKVKEVAVWVDEEEGAVFIALRADRSGEGVAAAKAVKKAPAKKAGKKE